MSSKLKFKAHYFILAVLLLFIEILIALFAHDRIIRPYLGDFIVVILIYCFIRSFINTSVVKVALLSLIFSYIVEALQYIKVVDKLGLQDSEFARTIIGTSFEWIDLIAYTLGIALVLLIERTLDIRTNKRSLVKLR